MASLPIETDRLTLRRFEDRDVPAILRLSADPSVHEVADELGSNEAEALDYIAKQRALAEFEPGALFDLVIPLRDSAPSPVGRSRDTGPRRGEVIGMATVVRGETTTEVGYALHSDFRGRGYATETAATLLEIAFGELDAAEVQAQVAPSNVASRAVLERIGMREVGGRFAVREAGDLAYAIGHDEWERRARETSKR